MRVLLVAPYVGEIGWELLSWQGRVRWVFERKGFDRLVVLGAEGKSGFYADMPGEYQVVDLSSVPGSAYEDRRVLQESQELLSPEAIQSIVEKMVVETVEKLQERGGEVETLWPAYSGVPWPCDVRHQRFIRFHRETPDPLPSPWVVLVKRTRSFGATNWSEQAWAELEKRLRNQGINTSIFPCDSEVAIEALSACDLAVGQSTAGLHVASLCGCPSLVWSVQAYLCAHSELTNQQRYETGWNPLGTPVQVYQFSQLPQPEEAAQQVIRALKMIGRHTGSVKQRVLFKSKWRIKNWLIQHMIQTHTFSRWPWPMQRFIRYKLI